VKIGFFSPMPPAKSGVADHAAELLPVLRQHMDVRPGKSGAVNLYHLGNNQLHADIYRRAVAEPGVAVLHDAVLHHFLLGYLGRSEYIEEFAYNYGDSARGLAEQLWDGRARSAADPRYFEYAMLRRVAERSRAVVVHNPAAARVVRRHAPDVKVVEIPLLLGPLAAPRVSSNRRFLCGIFGHLRESKRLPSAIDACRRADVDLVIAGDMSTELERALGPALAGVRHLPYTSRERFLDVMGEVDCCINLRYPPAGETSAIGLQAMGLGKAVVFTDGEEIARYPNDVCARVQGGLAELDHLEAVLIWLRLRRSHARTMGARAAEYVRECHSASRVAELYGQCFVD
jgi:hypothetical protein